MIAKIQKGANAMSIPVLLSEGFSTSPVSKTIRLRPGIDADGYRRIFKEKGYKIGEIANYIIDTPQLKMVTEETELDLVVDSVYGLTGKEGKVFFKEISDSAQRRGWSICPPQVGLELRLQYPEQPKGEKLALGMEAISDPGEYLSWSLFSLYRCDDTLWLDTYHGNSNRVWYGAHRFIFVRPRK